MSIEYEGGDPSREDHQYLPTQKPQVFHWSSGEGQLVIIIITIVLILIGVACAICFTPRDPQGEIVNQIRPITPQEAMAQTVTRLPDFVITAFNELIQEKISGPNQGSFVITKKEAVEKLLPFVPEGKGRQYIYDQHWLDVEKVFSNHGWSVIWDHAAYNEPGEDRFIFSVKKK